MEEENINITREPISISREYDTSFSSFKSNKDVDRSNWRETVLERNPDVKRMRELVNPLERAALFARTYLPDNRIVSHDVVLSLVSQHLRTLGLVETQGALHREWEEVTNVPHRQDSQLALLAQRALVKAGRFYDITVPSCHNYANAKLTQQALDTEISTTIGSTPKLLEDKNPLPLEAENDPRFIKYDENDIPVEASLNQLIYYSTSRKQGADELMKAMCLTITSYSSNKVFCKKIIDRTQMAIDQGKQQDLILCVKLLKEWKKGAGNSLEPEILETINKFVESHKSLAGCVVREAPDSLNPLSHLTDKTVPVELGKLSANILKGDFDLTDLPPAELARQLTVWSYMRYYMIQREELLDCSWEKPRLKHRAPNVVSMSSHFNLISNWTAHKILEEGNGKTYKDRVQKISYFIDVMRRLFESRNYFDTVGILGGLDSNELFRMKVHFSLLPQSDRDTLEKIQNECTPDKQFANLRKLFDEAIESKEPSIPYIGVLLSDLFKYDDATQPFINDLMNLRKVKKVYQMISRILQFSMHKYMYLPIDQVQDKLNNLQMVDEDSLFDLSLMYEPEGAQTEADLC